MDRRDDPHTRRDAEKLRFHRAAAERLREDPERVLAVARSNLARWQATGPTPYYQEWEEILRRTSVSDLISMITAEDERGQRLRQSTPFVGILYCSEKCRQSAKQKRYRDRNPRAAARAQWNYWNSITEPAETKNVGQRR